MRSCQTSSRTARNPLSQMKTSRSMFGKRDRQQVKHSHGVMPLLQMLLVLHVAKDRSCRSSTHVTKMVFPSQTFHQKFSCSQKLETEPSYRSSSTGTGSTITMQLSPLAIKSGVEVVQEMPPQRMQVQLEANQKLELLPCKGEWVVLKELILEVQEDSKIRNQDHQVRDENAIKGEASSQATDNSLSNPY